MGPRDRRVEVVQGRWQRQELRHVGLDRAGLLERRRGHPVDREREGRDRDEADRIHGDPSPAACCHRSSWVRSIARMYGIRTSASSTTMTTATADARPYWAPAIPFR